MSSLLIKVQSIFSLHSYCMNWACEWSSWGKVQFGYLNWFCSGSVNQSTRQQEGNSIMFSPSSPDRDEDKCFDFISTLDSSAGFCWWREKGGRACLQSSQLYAELRFPKFQSWWSLVNESRSSQSVISAVTSSPSHSLPSVTRCYYTNTDELGHPPSVSYTCHW